MQEQRVRENTFRQRLVLAMIEEMGGGAAEAVKRLQRNHGITPIKIAVEILGGVEATARVVGCTRQHFDTLMKRGPGAMRGDYLLAIEKATKIPVATLLLDGDMIGTREESVPKKSAPKSKK